MRIIKAEAYFGTLNHAKMSFDEGLTVRSMPNEAGKSTWCAFIRAMLYGMPQRERSTATFLAEKERYRPWAGGEDAFGRLVVSYKKRNIVLERTFSDTGRTKMFRAYYEDSGFDVTELNEENCGEQLCGVGREAFEKSGFISHNSMASGDSRELERKIQALASSGDEATSFNEALSRLERMKNDIRLNKAKGLIPRLEARLNELDGNIFALRNLAQRETSLRAKLLALDAEKRELARNIALIEEHDAYGRGQKVKAAQAQVQNIQEAYEKARQNVTFSDQQIDRAFLSDVSDLVSTVREKKTVKKAADDHRSSLWEDYEKTELRRNAQNMPKSAKKFPAKAIIIISLIMEAGAAALAFLSMPPGAAALAALGLLLLLFGLLKLSSQKKQALFVKQKEKEQAELEKTAEELELKYKQAQARSEEAKKELEVASKTLADITDFLGLSGKTTEELLGELKALDKKIIEFNDLHYRLKAAKETEAALYNAIDASRQEKPASVRPEGDISAYKNKLSLLNEDYASLFGEVNAVTGRMQQIGDLAVLESEREDTARKIDLLQFKYAALEESAEVLREASEELSKRVSPVLSQKAGEYFERMTGGKYEKVLIKQGFRELMASCPDGKMREVIWFSQGTADQLYLSLRLALCDMILKSDTLAPLILDDVFISFDDERLALAVRVLEEIAQRRQVIIFSCHDRVKCL